jgi:hypothetical protein
MYAQFFPLQEQWNAAAPNFLHVQIQNCADAQTSEHIEHVCCLQTDCPALCRNKLHIHAIQPFINLGGSTLLQALPHRPNLECLPYAACHCLYHSCRACVPIEAIATIAAAGDVLNISHAAGAGQPDLLLQLTGAEAAADAFRAHQAAVQQVRRGFLQADQGIAGA